MFDQNMQDNTQSSTQDNPVIANHGYGVSPISTNPTIPQTQPPANDISAQTPMLTTDSSFDSVANSIPNQSSYSGTVTPEAIATAPSNSEEELLSIKKDALQQLSPLVDHLDQSPEDKFKTMLMMIQASDDKSLLSSAYETAKKITDEQQRAQALLDIVNEINYFTQADKTA